MSTVYKLMEPDFVFPDERLATRDETLQFISDKGEALHLALDRQALLQAFYGREQEGPTGMIDGFAIPHAKSCAIIRPAVIVVKSNVAIADWETIDKTPVRCAIALLVPGCEAGSTHIRMLSRMATALMNDSFRAEVLECADARSISQMINKRLEIVDLE